MRVRGERRHGNEGTWGGDRDNEDREGREQG
jgi:hypothetical protein